MTAEVPIMPEAAIQLDAQERILSIQEIKDYVKQLT
ncbi:hypothetical protein [Sphingobacterium multivorum]